eukprot:g4546.t1
MEIWILFFAADVKDDVTADVMADRTSGLKISSRRLAHEAPQIQISLPPLPQSFPSPRPPLPQSLPFSLSSAMSEESSDASKRALGEAGYSQQPDKKQRGGEVEDGSTMLTLRLLVDDKAVGGLIGKKGVVVSKLRSDTGCMVDIAKPIQGASERVVTVQGRLDSLGVLLAMISARLQEHKQGNMSSEQLQQNVPDHSVTLLVDNHVVGILIGKGGATIADTRTASGASIRISEKSLGNSTEKSVTIRGSSQAVDNALKTILTQLQTKADKQVQVPYVPGVDPLLSMQSHMDPYGGGGVGGLAGYAANPYGTGAALNAYGGGGGYGMAASNVQRGYNDPSQPQTSVVVAVPENCIGSVIGKGGNTIAQIRLQSGATIQIPKKEQGSNSSERLVTVTGSAQCSKLAQTLIYQKIQEALQNQQTSM